MSVLDVCPGREELLEQVCRNPRECPVPVWTSTPEWCGKTDKEQAELPGNSTSTCLPKEMSASATKVHAKNVHSSIIHHSSKLDVIQLSVNQEWINGGMIKEQDPKSNEKEWTAATCNNMNELHRHNVYIRSQPQKTMDFSLLGTYWREMKMHIPTKNSTWIFLTLIIIVKN